MGAHCQSRIYMSPSSYHLASAERPIKVAKCGRSWVTSSHDARPVMKNTHTYPKVKQGILTSEPRILKPQKSPALNPLCAQVPEASSIWYAVSLSFHKANSDQGLLVSVVLSTEWGRRKKSNCHRASLFCNTRGCELVGNAGMG